MWIIHRLKAITKSDGIFLLFFAFLSWGWIGKQKKMQWEKSVGEILNKSMPNEQNFGKKYEISPKMSFFVKIWRFFFFFKSDGIFVFFFEVMTTFLAYKANDDIFLKKCWGNSLKKPFLIA